MGLGQNSKRSLSWQLPQLDAIMRDVPYFNKASSWKATRALVNGIDLNSRDTKVEDLTLIQKDLQNQFSAQHSVIKWGDFYGGSGGLLVFEDCVSEDDYKKPLIISEIKKGQFKGIKTLSRLYQIMPDLSSGLVVNVGEQYGIYSANEIGQPLYYNVNISGDREAKSKYFKVHRSRLLLYNSMDLTWVEKKIEMYFGPSLLERSYSDFARYESLLAQINKLAQRSNIPVLNIKNLPQMSLQGQRFVEYVTGRLTGINFGVSSGNMIILGDKEQESFSYENARFEQLPELLEHYRENLSSSLGAPTGVVFNDKNALETNDCLYVVKEIQERLVREWYNVLIPIMYRNRYGKSIKDFDFTFKSLEMPTEKEKAEKMRIVVEMLSDLFDHNIIDGESYARMLVASPNNISDIPNEITENYLQVLREGLEGKPFNKMTLDVILATALNHAQQGQDDSNLSNKVESAHGGKDKGGDPTKKNKPTVKVPINREKQKE